MRSFIAFAAVLAVANAAVLSTFDVNHAATLGWSVVGPAGDDTSLTVRISMPRANMDYLTATVREVSNPESPNYTKYPTMDEVRAATAPSAESVEAVTTWLVATGQHFTTEGHDIVVTTTTGAAAKLFSTSFRTVTNPATAQDAVVGDAVVVPDELAQHVSAVFGVHNLPVPPRQSVDGASVANVDPSVISSTYGLSGAPIASGSTTNRQAVVEFQGQLLSQSDLTTFFKRFVPHAKSGDDKVYKYVGDQQQGDGVEANLDIQYIMGVAPGILTEAWQYAGQGFCSDLKQWTSQVISTSNPPNVFSVSYGWQGDLSQIGCDASQVQAIDDDFKTITATGVSIIFASGDSGSGATLGKLYASWPASSEYVTAVGATRFINQTPGDGEQATDQFGSGGGFSRVITPAPEWQSAAIAAFYKAETNPPPQSDYGYGGRGTPDVAALGEGFQVVIGGNVEAVGGTSAAAPTFAAIVSLLNEERAQHSKGPLGLLNQWLYSNSDAFHDVTVGSDRISRSGLPVTNGFDCEPGWDPVTGWGTPNWTKLSAAAMQK